MSVLTRGTDGASFNLDRSDPSFALPLDRRATPRGLRRRMRLRVTTSRGSSFTVNVGAKGVCTEQLRVLPVGTLVEGHVFIGGRGAAFSGRVAWAFSGDARLNQLGRMGLHFDRVDAGYGRGLLEREDRWRAAAA